MLPVRNKTIRKVINKKVGRTHRIISEGFSLRAFSRKVQIFCSNKGVEVSNQEASALACIIDSFRMGRYSHENDDSLSRIAWNFKQDAFGSAKRFDDINKVVKMFICEIKPNRHMKRAGGWRLSEEINNFSDSFIKTVTNEELQSGGLITPLGNKYRIQKRAISSKARIAQLVNIRCLVDVDTTSLSMLCAAADAWEFDEPCPIGSEWLFEYWRSLENSRNAIIRGREKTLEHVRLSQRQARQLIAIAKASNKKGSIPVRYGEVSTGRLYESSTGVTLQGCCREVKKSALKGCVDIDIENCHWSLLSQMAKKCEVDTPYIDNYLNNKKLIRNKLALESMTDIDGAKTILIAMIYGARFTKNMNENYSDIVKKIGQESAQRASESSIVKNLLSDLKLATKAVINRYYQLSKKTGFIINDAAKQISSSEDDKKKLAHILQGAEVTALIAMAEVIGDSVCLLQHDGLTVRRELSNSEIIAIEAQIKKATGFSLSVERETL